MFNFLRPKQKAYDEFVLLYREIDLTEHELFNKKAHALLSEVWEVSNELQYFKYWKTEDTSRGKVKKIKEELADCLFFQLSLANDLDVDLKAIDPYEEDTVEERIRYMTRMGIRLTSKTYDREMYVRWLHLFYTEYIGLLRDYGVTGEEIIKAYADKYKVNLVRQVEGY
ncbi:MAG: dUTP diphosphatase [Paraclostridium sp.]